MPRTRPADEIPTRSTQPIDINKRLSELILISGQLADMLDRENDALARYDRKTFVSLVEEKTRLGRIYETQMIGLSKSKEEDFVDADPDLRDRLRALGDEVRDLIARNARLLKIAIEANRRVVDAIADAVKSSVPNPGVYGGQGRVAAAGSHAHPSGPALSFDRSL
ncbi:MAG: flagellar protein FlgN [Alphaproteobacteria bacterium]|nr:flagellar protein FlgN [Alphaproteobacteria bacterium]